MLIRVTYQREYASVLGLARRAERLGEEISDQAALRARTWVWAARSWTDPTFNVVDLRPQVDAAIEAARAAGDADGILDGLQGLLLIDLNHAHWTDTADSARRGLEVAREHRLDVRGSDFARWLSNALVWGTVPASDGIREIEGLLASEERRSQRASMLACLSVLHGILDDRAGVEATDAAATAILLELGDRPHGFRLAFARLALDDLPGAMAAARGEEDELARLGETGQRSTMVALQAWIHALLGENEAGLRRAEDARRLGASDDAVTQLVWRTAAGLAQGQLGHLTEADRLTAEAVAIATETDSLSAADAWEARARVLHMLGRRDEMLQAAARARDLHALKGSVNFLRRLERFLADADPAARAAVDRA